MKKHEEKKHGHGLLVVGAAAAAAGVLYSQKDNPKLKPVFDKAAVLKCRTNSTIMDIGTKTMSSILFPFPKEVSGRGCVQELPRILTELGVERPLIVTGPTVGRVVVPPIREELEKSGFVCTVFAAVEENPSVKTVEAIREMYIESGSDGFLAIGGGSPMDAAKAAEARIARPELPVTKMGGMLKVVLKAAPIIAVPTTAGTGSEATSGSVISDHDNHHKYAITDPSLVPDYAVLDPLLTLSVPPKVTAATGMDVLTHAVESYVTWAYNNNFTNRCAEEATVKVFKYLERAYNDGSDIDAREQMLIASYKAGLAFTRTGVGYVHSIAHGLGGLYGTAHGLANAVILPIVLEDYGEVVHPQLAHLAEITGVKDSGTDAEKAAAFISEIRAMNRRMGIPTGFDFIKPEDIDQLVEWALAEANGMYPVPVVYNAERCRHVINRIILEA